MYTMLYTTKCKKYKFVEKALFLAEREELNNIS